MSDAVLHVKPLSFVFKLQMDCSQPLLRHLIGDSTRHTSRSARLSNSAHFPHEVLGAETPMRQTLSMLTWPMSMSMFTFMSEAYVYTYVPAYVSGTKLEWD